MSVEAIYKGAIMEHFRSPRNHGDLAGCERTARLYNPLCGDELEIGVHLAGDRLETVRFRHRACSVCVASASMMSEAVTGVTVSGFRTMRQAMHDWLAAAADAERPEPLPDTLAPIDAVRRLSARRRCVTLPWEGVAEALAVEVPSTDHRAKP